jgi:hypothetical protein
MTFTISFSVSVDLRSGRKFPECFQRTNVRSSFGRTSELSPFSSNNFHSVVFPKLMVFSYNNRVLTVLLGNVKSTDGLKLLQSGPNLQMSTIDGIVRSVKENQPQWYFIIKSIFEAYQ